MGADCFTDTGTGEVQSFHLSTHPGANVEKLIQLCFHFYKGKRKANANLSTNILIPFLLVAEFML